MVLTIVSLSLSAQVYKADRLRKAVDVLGLQIVPDSLLPDTTFSLSAKDGRIVCLRTDPMGAVEHVGVPLFSDMMRLLQPSPVYDFLEYAVLNWKYKVNPNQLYLSKVIFKTGSWETLLRNRLNECECFIENREDKLYIVTWKRDDKEIAIVGIPIEYELLNNDTRRNMERAFIKDLGNSSPSVAKPNPAVVSEESLSIYGTGGLFVIPGRSYIIDLLNQNVYYKLTTVYETADTVINKKTVTMSMEAVLPVVVIDPDFPAETFANLMMRRIYNVLIVANPYDAFMLEDDGRVDEKIYNEYVELGLRYPPTFTQVSTIEQAREVMSSTHIDLVITMPGNADNDAFSVARQIKAEDPEVRCVVLTPFSHGITRRMQDEDLSMFDYVFCWLGNTNLILSIIKLIEDRMNLEHDIQEAGVQLILLVEDSIRFYSSLLPNLYQFVLQQSLEFATA